MQNHVKTTKTCEIRQSLPKTNKIGQNLKGLAYHMVE